MPVTQSDLHQLHQRLIEVLGSKPAGTLMELLVPGWGRTISNGGLARFRDVEQRLERLEEQMLRLDARRDESVPSAKSNGPV